MPPAERCDLVVVKLEKVHELFQVCRICGKGVVFYNMAQYGILYHKSLLTQNLQFIYICLNNLNFDPAIRRGGGVRS